MERGEVAAEEFMKRVNAYVEGVVRSMKKSGNINNTAFQNNTTEREVIGECPRCQKDVIETEKSFSCTERNCKYVLWKDSKYFTSKKKQLTKRIAKALTKDGKVALRDLYSERTGKKYSATIKLVDSDYTKYPSYELAINGK